MAYLCYVMTMPGLETLAFSEIRARFPGTELVKYSRGLTLFRTSTPPAELLTLRTVEDVFLVIAHIHGVSAKREALKALHAATIKADCAPALSIWGRIHKGKRARTWRLVSQMYGERKYRRVDAGDAVSGALRKSLPQYLHPVKENADMEFWLWINNNEALVGLRLSDATMRHRLYKQEHLPASLRPTVAAALCWLSRPTKDDVVLDPLCGAGTILVERGLMAPADELLGGDIREEAIAMAKRNARVAKVDVEYGTWDARHLPLDPESVTRIISNLPFGKQIGTPEKNRELYEDLAKEFHRVLTPDGLMVTLTSEERLWGSLLRANGWHVLKKLVIAVLGQPATIFVAERAKKNA